MNAEHSENVTKNEIVEILKLLTPQNLKFVLSITRDLSRRKSPATFMCSCGRSFTSLDMSVAFSDYQSNMFTPMDSPKSAPWLNLSSWPPDLSQMERAMKRKNVEEQVLKNSIEPDEVHVKVPKVSASPTILTVNEPSANPRKETNRVDAENNKDVLDVPQERNESHKKMKYLSKYLSSWESEFNLHGVKFLTRGKDDGFAYCTLCTRDILIKHMGKSAIVQHVSGRAHINNFERAKKLLKQ
ncbi:hypothetical protein ACOME3_002863 [Neoechinorhynchus agilis]